MTRVCGWLNECTHVQEFVDYVRLGSREDRVQRGQEFQNPMKQEYKGPLGPLGRGGALHTLYTAPAPGNGSLHVRPSYLGNDFGASPPAPGAANDKVGVPAAAGGIQLGRLAGGGSRAGSGGSSQGGAPPAAAASTGATSAAAGGPGVPRSAFADRVEEGIEEEELGGSGELPQQPRQPLHPLASHGLYTTAQLPPRPSELLKVYDPIS